MSTYVISDIHGCYEKYRQMLDKIYFSNDDTLFVLGDVVDRGPQPVKVLQDMMCRPNVVPLIGNHELMALTCLKFLTTEVTEETVAHLESDTLQILLEWMGEGGQSTIDGFSELSVEERKELTEYLGEFSLYEEVSVNGREYLLVHAGLGNFSPEKPIEGYTLEEMLFDRPDYSRVYFPDRYLVTGHTPTRNIRNHPNPDSIYRENNHIAIDCGCVFGGRLGAVCLEDGREFYV